MGNEGSSRRKTACNDYKWSASSAARKLVSDTSVTVGGEISSGALPGGKVNASVTKNIGKHDPQKDAYRNCKNCHMHRNYHKKEKLPGK